MYHNYYRCHNASFMSHLQGAGFDQTFSKGALVLVLGDNHRSRGTRRINVTLMLVIWSQSQKWLDQLITGVLRLVFMKQSQKWVQ